MLIGMDTVEKDILLISLVEGSEALYDKSNEGFKNEKLKESLWQYIAGIMEEEVAHVRKRWTSLRDSFLRAHRKMEEATPSGSGAKEEKEPKFLYYANMKWLAQYIRKRRTASSWSSQSTSTNSSGDSGSTSLLETQIFTLDASEGDLDKTLPPEGDLREKLPSGGDFNKKVPRPDGFFPSKKAKKDAVGDMIGEMCAAVKGFASSRSATPTSSSAASCANCGNLDEGDRAFMISITRDMEVLSRNEKIRFKKKVADFLDEIVNPEV